MADRRTIQAEVKGEGVIRHALIRLEDQTELMRPSDDGHTHTATLTVDITGDLQVFLVVNAFFGTEFTFQLTLDEGGDPFFKPKSPPLVTDTMNNFSHLWNIPAP